MDFAHRLIELRKHRGLTQQAMADAIGVHLSQQRRYEAGTSQPTLEVLKRIALTLGVTIDHLAFGDDGRRPQDELLLAFETASRLGPDAQAALLLVIDALRHRHDTQH